MTHSISKHTTQKIRSLTVEGSTSEPILLPDGTLWSHAASLGTFFYRGEQVTLDPEKIDAFVRNFTSGYRTKVPVDYEHGSDSDSKGRPVPKGGDVLELRGVYRESDFTGDLKASAEKLAALAGRTLSDPSSFGLWMRWRPTDEALGMIKSRAYSEHSISFTDDYLNPRTGQPQGPTLHAVALTNRPFLTDMIPVAASEGASDSPPAAPASHAPHKEHSMQNGNARLFSAVAALTSAAPTDEENAFTQLSALAGEVRGLRALRDDVLAATGETDITKASAKVKSLSADVARLEGEAAAAKKARVKTDVDATLKKFEDRIVPAQKPFFAKLLTQELENGVTVEKSETVAVLEAMPKHSITDQASAGDDGTKPDGDVQLDAKARELMNSDTEVKALNDRDGFAAAFKLATRKARAALAK